MQVVEFTNLLALPLPSLDSIPQLLTTLNKFFPAFKMAPDWTHAFEAKDLITALAQVGIGGEDPSIDKEYRGGQCHIFKVQFQTTAVAVRASLYDRSEAKIDALTAELRMLRALEAKGFAWSPRCLGESLTFDNPIKHPFLVLGWIHGEALSWDEETPPRPTRDKVLGQMAAIQLALIECTLENGAYDDLSRSNCAESTGQAPLRRLFSSDSQGTDARMSQKAG